jgi:hypothetical protein
MSFRGLALGLALLGAGARSGKGQSTHLILLETSSPATSPEPLTSLASRGWAALWANPSADVALRGVALGAERNSFGAVRTVFAQAAFRAGARWSVSAAQTSVSDLFDPELVAQDPTLADLRATAMALGVDAAVLLRGYTGASAGVRLETDDLLGDVRRAAFARAGVGTRLALGVRLAATLERHVTGNVGPVGPGRALLGLGRRWSGRSGALSVGLGAEAGGLWRATRHHRAAAVGLAVTLRNVLGGGASYRRERDIFAPSEWQGATACWLGLSVSRFSVQGRITTGVGEASPVLGVAVSFTAGP